ncbi:NAD(P)-dependent oxidoreductase [Agromyces aerolatus]|uniref:NAD(P)-dependent oxidoreductase n=1 Tax=Agromyces sp. LY-1074 TaxID=3074080 RepID=UPI002862B27C|nr:MULTISPECIES: NAD(P)-dependent oxidoreductase [unclassified Agromyces]MDR5699121.1 NAD(P)-dependent oxidoreductase [Agromyces sp. LY-1074]MDR5705100.1 NAD(P)-dependent oxidoreductase [Agromyces sp. LY-1358]
MTAVEVGFVGLGSMGAPMARRMVEAGHTVRVYARRPESAAAAAACGAIPVASAAEAARGADVMTVCVYTTGQVRELCLGEDGLIAAMKPGSTLLVHTTCPPDTIAELVALAAGRGVAVSDAPLDGRPADVAAGRTRVLMGADAETRKRVVPLVETYANTIIHVGDVGAGQRTKILNVLLTATQTAMIADAARLAGQLGLDPAAALTAVNQTGVTSRHLESALTFDDDPTRHAQMVRPFVVKDILNYGDLFDGLDLGLLDGVVRELIAAEDQSLSSPA